MKEYSTDRLLDIMTALTAEHDIDKLLKSILTYAMDMTECDGGTIYTKDGDFLYFQHMITRSKDVSSSASDGSISLPPVPLGRKHVCACAALDKNLINLPDIYASDRYDFEGAKQYDLLNGYRTGSMLVVPMVDEKDRVIGVVQLINAKDDEGNIVPFGEKEENLVYGLSSLVAISMNNHRLSEAFYSLLHSFVQVMVGAIDLRTPYNANHTKSMVSYGEAFISWLNSQNLEWNFEEEMIDPFLMSIWLHDIGKLITPVEVVEKATRLGSRLDDVLHRLTVAELMEELHGYRFPDEADACNEKKAELQKVRETILSYNSPGFMTDAMLAEVDRIGEMTCRNEKDEEIPLLLPEEHKALSVRKGTLTDEERGIIEGHVVYTAKMLSKMKFEAEYASVPVWAASHHELLDGTGYPDHKKGEELPREVRLITIIDVYDALTAGDRPYKAPLSPEKAFSILDNMVSEGKIDGEILRLFKKSEAWKKQDDSE